MKPKGNGKPDPEVDDSGVLNLDELDLDHELPAGEAEADVSAVPEAGALEPPTAAAPADRAELEKLRGERDELLDRLARLQADFENARKRAVRDAQEYKEYAVTDAVRGLLPILDSLDRALKAPSGQADFRAGIELIYRQFQDSLAKLGVQAIPAKGEYFDPTYHEAVQMVEQPGTPDNTVIEELSRGYKFKDRLLRPAMVVVARKSE